MRQLIRHLEDALALADEIQDGHTEYLIECAPRDHQALHRRGHELIDELVKAMRRAMLRGLADKNSWKCDEESS
jgi:hypothetical protein